MSSEETPLSGIRVLVVEDEAFARSMITRVLEVLGIEGIHAVENGREALEVLASGTDNFDLVISDIEMPEMDGYELVRKVRMGGAPDHKDVPILILTGKDTDRNVQRARFHKINGFVVKPPEPKDIERKIRHALVPASGK